VREEIPWYLHGALALAVAVFVWGILCAVARKKGR